MATSRPAIGTTESADASVHFLALASRLLRLAFLKASLNIDALPPQFSAAFQIMDRGLPNRLILSSVATGSFVSSIDRRKQIAHLKTAGRMTRKKPDLVANPGAARDLAELFCRRFSRKSFHAKCQSVSMTSRRLKARSRFTGQVAAFGVTADQLFAAAVRKVNFRVDQKP